MSPLVQALLIPLSWLYGAGVWARNRCYDSGIFKAERFGVPVVSVGNMTAGGTGKTPFVEYLVKYFMKKGKRVAVLSRGYKRSSMGTVVVSGGGPPAESPERSGDEPYQIARRFPGSIVISDRVRTRSALIAEERYHADVILLDDGFQHRAVARDLDIVMVGAGEPLGRMKMLPAGLRREPLSSLRRAGLLARSVAAGPRPEAGHAEGFENAPSISVRTSPESVYGVFGMDWISPGGLIGKHVTAFSGIAKPERFEEMLRDMGMSVAGCIRFPDHHWFTRSDFVRIREAFERSNASHIMTTEKDAVRCLTPEGVSILGALPACFVRISADITEGREYLASLLDSLLTAREAIPATNAE